MPPLPSQTFDTAPETQQQELHSPDMVHQQPAVESMPLTEAAVEQEHRSVTGTVAEQAPVQKLQHALAKTQEVGKMAVDQIWSSATDIQAKGKAAVDHVNASAPDLAPVNKHLQDLSQVVLQQTQAAATQGQHIGQSSFRQVRSSASGVTKQIPWDRLQPPSWLPGLPQSSFDSMQQQNIPADAAPFVQQHYSNSYRPAHGVYASDTTVAPSSAGIEQVHVVNAASAQEPALPAYRWHSKNHTNHLAALSAAPSQHSASFSSPFSADAPIPNCTFVQSSIQLPGVPEYSNITSHLCAQTDAPLQMPQQLPTPGSVESVLLGDLSDSQPGGAEQETASLVQEPASLTTNGSARYSWDRTGRLVGDGTASPHYKPGAPHAPRGKLQVMLGTCSLAPTKKTAAFGSAGPAHMSCTME